MVICASGLYSCMNICIYEFGCGWHMEQTLDMKAQVLMLIPSCTLEVPASPQVSYSGLPTPLVMFYWSRLSLDFS